MGQSRPLNTKWREDTAPEEHKRLALRHILEAWDKALDAGVEPELLASSAIYAALSDMVDIYGEEPVASMAESLPERIRTGEFSLAGPV
ncbi:MAG: hypothetical protein AAF527_07200, partial [Pseudomonadota bacterium]